jgi:hypothetical protein
VRQMRNRYAEDPVKMKKKSKPQCVIMWICRTDTANSVN